MSFADNDWFKIAGSINDISFGANNIAEVSVAGKQICIAKWKNDYFAFAQTCPHASGRLAEGFIDALGNVVCPVHHYRFCLKNGRNVTGEGYTLKWWPVKIDAGVFIKFNVV